jgi:hypothetical protein
MNDAITTEENEMTLTSETRRSRIGRPGPTLTNELMAGGDE